MGWLLGASLLASAVGVSLAGAAHDVAPDGGAGAKPQPHLIFVMADDQGHKNGYLNPELITPHTREIVAEGVRFLNHYVFKFCSPTRSSFLSGRLPIHVNMENSATEQPRAGVEVNFTMISEVLHAAGYKSAHVGKWHAGQASNLHVPKGRGFDQALSFFNFGEDHYTQIRGGNALSDEMRIGQGYDSPDGHEGGACPQAVDLWGLDGPSPLNGSYGGYIFTDEVVRVVEEHDAKSPLFMYIAFQNIHPPLQVPQSFIDMQHKPELRTEVNGMITFLDESIGNLTAALKRTGLWENLLLVYSPDNGGYLGNGGDDTPLRGGKFSDFQGGVKVAAFASGGLIPAAMRGTNVSGDWYRTFAKLAGVPEEAIFDQRAKAASLPPLDSLDVWPLLSGANATSPRVEIPLSTLPGLNGGWNGLALPEHDEPGTFRDPNYFSGGEGLIVGEWKIVTGWQPIGPFGSGHTPSCNNKTAMQNDGVGWGKENGAPPGTPAGAKGWGRYGVNCDCGDGCLFHLPSVRLPLPPATTTAAAPWSGWIPDPNEVNDLAVANPAMLSTMAKRLAAIRDTTYAPARGALDPAACVANDKAGGYWSPWLFLHRG